MDFNTFFKGVAMGMAEAVPGVSGGTIAFISGIYDRLLGAIRSFDINLIKVVQKEGLKGAAKAVDFRFLSVLFFGMFGGIVAGVYGIHYLIINYPPVVWSFFFGLILASFFYLLRSIGNLNMKLLLLIAIGALAAGAISILNPLHGSANLFYVFISGFLAISALMLPGVSGSFILLLLGMYVTVTGTVKSFLSAPNGADFVFLTVLALGCLMGVVVLSRGLSYLLEKHRASTLSILTGFVLGSLVKIWPWQNPIVLMDKEDGALLPYGGQNILSDEYEVVESSWVLPESYFAEPFFFVSVLAAFMGFGIVFLLCRLERK